MGDQVSQPPPSEGPVRATVIIDVSSFAHALAAGARRRGDVKLASVFQVLCDLGFDSQRFCVALAVEPVTTGSDSDLSRARHFVQRDREWASRETSASPVAVSVAPGAHNGIHEIGVDDMVVAATLIEAARIRSDSSRQDEAIIVLTHDSDMDHLGDLVAPTPLVLVGHFDAAAQRRLGRTGASFVSLDRGQMRRCGEHPRSNWIRPLANGPGPTFVGVKEPEPLPIAPTTAIVDAYGLACSAATVLGLARIPSIGSIRHVLSVHGELSAETALLVTIPDIIVGKESGDPMGKGRVRAWRDRRVQLNRLARRLSTDGDPSTMERRAVLRPSRIPSDQAGRLDRRGPVRAAKRLSTQMTADLVRSILEESTSSVVLMTDSPHLAWVQSRLPGLLGSAWPATRVIRWGVTAAPVLVHPDGVTPRLPDADFMVLTERRLAELVCLSSRVAPEALRDVLNDAGRAGFDGSKWKVVGYDPELDGVTVRSETEQGLEVTLAGGLALGLQVGSTLDNLGDGVELRFEPSSPSAMPVLAGRRTPHGSRATRFETAEIVDRSGTFIRFDVNQDGVADVGIDVVHDLRPIRPDASATLGHLQLASPGSHEWVYVSSSDDSVQRHPEVVKVISVDTDGGILAGHPGRADTWGQLLPPPGAPEVDVDQGESLWAINVGLEAARPAWVTLSTALKLSR